MFLTTIDPLDLMFTSEIGKPLHYRNLTQRHYEKILENAGLGKKGFVLYSLRHSCATLLLSTGRGKRRQSTCIERHILQIRFKEYILKEFRF
jgi:integrase